MFFENIYKEKKGGFLAWGSCPKGALLGDSDFYPRPIKKYNFSINSNDNIFTIKIYIKFNLIDNSSTQRTHVMKLFYGRNVPYIMMTTMYNVMSKMAWPGLATISGNFFNIGPYGRPRHKLMSDK